MEESCRESGDWCCSVSRTSERSIHSVVFVECRKVLEDSSWTTATVQQPFSVKGDRDQRLNNVRGVNNGITREAYYHLFFACFASCKPQFCTRNIRWGQEEVEDENLSLLPECLRRNLGEKCLFEERP